MSLSYAHNAEIHIFVKSWCSIAFLRFWEQALRSSS